MSPALAGGFPTLDHEGSPAVDKILTSGLHQNLSEEADSSPLEK